MNRARSSARARLRGGLNLGFSLLALGIAGQLHAQQAQAPQPTASEWGGIGLLQTPTARMAADGDLAFTASHVAPYARYNLTLQPLPWLEGSFRYINIANRRYGPQSLSGDQHYKDKSIDFKLRLWQESHWAPEVALGFRDFGGTGLFSSEYLVSNKRFGPIDASLGLATGYIGNRGDFSNPLGWIDDRFKQRSKGSGRWGDINGKSMFRGPVGVFGGIAYQTPWQPLQLKLEYDGNDYRHEPQGNNQRQRTPVNIGLVYALSRNVQISAGWERGDEAMFAITFRSNPGHAPTPPKPLDPPPEPLARLARADADHTAAATAGAGTSAAPAATAATAAAGAGTAATANAATRADAAAGTGTTTGAQAGTGTGTAAGTGVRTGTAARTGTTARTTDAAARTGMATSTNPAAAGTGTAVSAQAAASIDTAAGASTAARTAGTPTDWQDVARRLHNNAGIEVDRISRRGPELVVTGEQRDYFYPAQGLGRAARILDNSAPTDVQWFTLRNQRLGMPISEASVSRDKFTDYIDHRIDLEQLRLGTELDPPAPDAGQPLYQAPLHHFSGGFNLGYHQNLGGPDGFILYQINANYSASWFFTRNLWLSGTASANLINNYDKFKYDAPSNLPRVRTDLRQYMTTSDVTLPNLQLTTVRRLGHDLYGMAYAGYLEWMYAGAGGELLYRPWDERWAVGVNANWVKQRDYDQHFGLRGYHVGTGHATLYRSFGRDQRVLASLSAGRYLAGDWGATLNVARVFSNGVTMGAYVTKTNVSAEKFGEGSFDKGIYFSIPFDAVLPRSTRARATLLWQPLIRDGGAMLNRKYALYPLTDERDGEFFEQNLDKIDH